MPADEEELYQEHILDHYEDPYHRGHCTHCTHAHQDDNPLCGNVVRMELQIDDRGTLREVFFDGDGCCISQAAASMIAERFDGRTIEDVKTVHRQRHAATLRRPPHAQPAEMLLAPWRVLQSAIYSPVEIRVRLTPADGKVSRP